MRRTLIYLICLGCLSCYSQSDKSLIINWKSYPIPTNKDTLIKNNYSQNEWRVFLKDNILHVANVTVQDSPIVPFKIDHGGKTHISAIQVNDGYVVGFNSGEWGGHLDWFSKDGKTHYQISDDQVAGFIKKDGKIYVIQGLAHLTLSFGSILKIERDAGKWISKEYLKLPFAPSMFASDAQGNFIIITSKNLLKVDKNKMITTLVKNGMWYLGPSPNSIVFNNNAIYAGMRAGVYKYNLTTGREEWLMPN